jgi:hypothetical protein
MLAGLGATAEGLRIATLFAPSWPREILHTKDIHSKRMAENSLRALISRTSAMPPAESNPNVADPR